MDVAESEIPDMSKHILFDALMKYNDVDNVKLIFDGGKRNRSDIDRVRKKFGMSRIRYFEVDIYGTRYYYDGKTCGKMMNDDDNMYVLRNDNIWRKKKGCLSKKCVKNMCFVCVCNRKLMVKMNEHEQ
jgi:hypothetical protein